MCYWILTAKVKLTARTTVQNFVKGVDATDDLQRIIGHYNKCLAEAFGQGEHYARNLDGLEGFTNDDVPNQYETYKDSYKRKNYMLDVDDYVNNADDS